MDDDRAEDVRPPRIPTHAPLWITVVAIVIATLFACALVYVLMNETTGPGEVLQGFYTAMDEGDCPDAYELTSDVSEDTVCSSATQAKGTITGSPRIDSITLAGPDGDTATVIVTEAAGSEPVTWEIQLVEGAWLITGCPTTGELANAC